MSLSVLHVIPAVAPRYGGPSAAVVGMCQGLADAGIAATIATTDADGPARLGVPLGEIGSHLGVPTIFFERRGDDSFKWSAPLARWLRERVSDFDLVHVHAVFSHSTLAAGRACLRAGVPYVVRPLGALDPWSLGRHAWRKRLLWRVGLGRVMAGAAAMHYTTDAEQRLASQTAGLATGFVAPIGLDPMWFEPATEPIARRRDLIVLARLDPKKGIETAIAAFHLLAAEPQWRDWSLVIAGDGDERYVDTLRAAAAQGPGRDRISFSGWLDGPARVERLRQSSLFVLPSHQENFGIAVAEAMAVGTPVVVSPDVNLAPDIEAGEAGWIVARDAGDVSLTLAAAMGDEAERARRGARAQQVAARFRWPEVAAELSRVYAGLLRTSRH